VDKIKRSYGALLKEEAPQVDEPRSILNAVELQGVVPVLTEQCQKVSQARSTLAFAVEEKYRIGELFAGLAGEKAPVDRFLQREAHTYAELEAKAQNEPISGERSVSRPSAPRSSGYSCAGSVSRQTGEGLPAHRQG